MSTVLQISDPHLMSQPDGTLKGVPTFENLKLVLAKARDAFPDPARVVLSGDLSHEHTEAGYALLRDLLGDWTERALLIPGNHDDRVALRSVFPQTPGQGDDFVTFCDEVDGWQLIGLDSHVPEQVYGELSDTVLDQLRGWLQQSPQQPTLIFLHHPPTSVNCPWMDEIALRNPEPLADAVAQAPGVRGVFCGHVHHVFEGSFAGVPFRSAPAVSFQFAPQTETMRFDFLPPGFRVIELGDTDFTTDVVRLDKLRFAPQDS